MSADILSAPASAPAETEQLDRIEALAAMLGKAPASSVFSVDVLRKKERVQENVTLRVCAGKRSWGRQAKQKDGAKAFLATVLLQALAPEAEACPSCLQPVPRVDRPGKLYRCKCMHSWRE